MTGSAHCTCVLVPKKWQAGSSIITCYLQCNAYWLHLSNKTIASLIVFVRYMGALIQRLHCTYGVMLVGCVFLDKVCFSCCVSVHHACCRRPPTSHLSHNHIGCVSPPVSLCLYVSKKACFSYCVSVHDASCRNPWLRKGRSWPRPPLGPPSCWQLGRPTKGRLPSTWGASSRGALPLSDRRARASSPRCS